MIDHTHAAIPDWLVRAAGWAELAYIAAAALALALAIVAWLDVLLSLRRHHRP